MTGIELGHPYFFQSWAFAQTTGSPTRKAVLSMLAHMADHNTGRCEAKQDTLAQGVEVSSRSISTHLRALEEAGLIARRAQYRKDGRRRGDEFLLLAPGVTEWPDGDREGIPQPRDEGSSGGNGQQGSELRGSPEAGFRAGTTTRRTATSDEGGRRAPDPRETVPEDFPPELRPHANAVYAILKRVAEQHGAKRVWPLEVARAIMAAPRKPLVAAAHDLEGWAVDPRRPVKDVAGTYRTFLAKRRDLAGVERLHDDGTPASAGPSGVVPGRPSGDSANLRDMADRLRERGQ